MDVERSRISVVPVAPHLIEQLLARGHAATLFGQSAQQRELFICELHCALIARRANIVKVDLQATIIVNLRRGLCGSRTEKGLPM